MDPAPGPPLGPADGVLLWDKPAGMTSHDVVATVRRHLPRGVRVGHAGTLDPFATGLLLVLLGRATRIQRYLMALPKRYEVTARLGWRSSTGDPEGVLETTGRIPELGAVLPRGEILQAPPAHSAVKVSGERAYRRARRGEDVRPAPRPVVVHAFEERWRRADRAGYVVECSAGTYVRVLIGDLGDAYCETLRRTHIGRFAVEEADGRTVIGLDRALDFLPERRLAVDDARRAGHGVAVPGTAEGPVRLVGPDGIIAVGEPRGSLLKPVVGFLP